MRRLLSIAVTLLLVSCAPAVTTIPTPSAEAATTAAPPTEPPSLASPLATPTASVAVAPTESPALGERLVSAQADFDCDGSADRLEFYERLGVVPGGSSVLARLTLASGSASEVVLPGDVGSAPLIGVTDVNGDGCADAIVTVGHGASTVWTSFLVYDGSVRLVEEDGAPATFLFSGSVRHGNSIECRRTKDTAEIVARGVSDYTSDFEWDVVEDVHHWSGRSRLVLWSTMHSVIAVTVRYAAPPDHERYWGLSCGDVKTG